jgi:hypothetical protein
MLAVRTCRPARRRLFWWIWQIIALATDTHNARARSPPPPAHIPTATRTHSRRTHARTHTHSHAPTHTHAHTHGLACRVCLRDGESFVQCEPPAGLEMRLGRARVTWRRSARRRVAPGLLLLVIFGCFGAGPFRGAAWGWRLAGRTWSDLVAAVAACDLLVAALVLPARSVSYV